MQYIEIGQDIVNAIKGGAGYDGQDEATEIVASINSFAGPFAEIVKTIKDFVMEVYEALKKYF